MYLLADAISVADAVADSSTLFNAAMDMISGQPVLVAAVFAPIIIGAGLKIFRKLKGVAH